MILPSSGGGGGTDIDDYVSDGIIFWLDGIYNTANGHDATSSVWEDLSGNGYDYTYGSSNIIGDDYCNPNNDGGSRAKQFSSAHQTAIRNGGTIEIVMSPTSLTATYIIIPSGNYRGTISTKSGVILFSAASPYINVEMKSGVHYYNSSYWRDGVAYQGSSITTSWSNAYSYLFRYNSTSYKFRGNVYAIRIYSRALSNSEMTQNWLTDKNRFGITPQ